MRVCFVLDCDPCKSEGGTPSVVNQIKKCTGGIVLHGSRNPLANFFLMLLLPLRISVRKCDIINIHDTHGYFYTFWPFRKKTVYTCHNLWNNYHKAMQPKTLTGVFKSKLSVFLEKRLITKSDHVTTVSESVRSQIIREYRLNPEKITAIHNGVDTRKFVAGKMGDAFIWVGDNPELKGLGKAIEYSRKKRKKLIVVGIRGRSTKNVEYIGKVGNDEMPGIYLMADTLLFFSKTEGHPLVPLEAAACGLNIIANKESNLEIFPLRKGIYSIKSKDAIKTAKRYDWNKRTILHKKLFMKILETK
ncbi:MAG: glycosyltransferase family 4 protein [Candidatus Aenigmarchaeota archaeon]|nr:glycosyltransferase family 4 protein [Candidatus Aenigmarchaeota archaeon]MDI6722195.1 glycosyltransferase family 4 protein [Candidatus Aenigmarchaeota archaeon]